MEVLLGGMVTLVVTFIVQVFLIPRVQAHTRNRERWENDVVELRTLIEEELDEAQLELYAVGHAAIFVEFSHREDASSKDASAQRALTQVWRRYDKACNRCHELKARLSRLEGRVSLRNRTHFYWRKVTLARMAYSVAISSAYQLSAGTDVTLEKWEEINTQIKQRYSELVKVTRTVTHTMKPPAQPIARKLYRWTRSRLKALLRRKRRSIPSSS